MPEVYGEETLEIDVSRGLWLGDRVISTSRMFGNVAESQGIAPEGYASAIVNMVKNPRGNWVPRNAFFAANSAVLDATYFNVQNTTVNPHTGYESFAPGNENLFVVDLPGYKANLPTAIFLGDRNLINYAPTTGIPPAAVSLQNIIYNALAQTYQPRTFTLYKDRMYACNSTGAWYRMTGWGAFTVSPVTLTETLLPGANNTGMTDLTGIFAFKDRIFCYRQNRVFYTDVAAAGGYPETWDQTINFFDLPSSGSPTIWNAFIIQNLVYLFTEDGIYTLQVYGTPENWVVAKLRDDVVINHHFAAANNAGIIYFTDYEGVKAFNGDKVVTISQPLEGIFGNVGAFGGDGMFGCGIAAFEKGCILTVQIFGGLGTTRYVSRTMTLYFDGEVWSEFRLPGRLGADNPNSFPSNLSSVFSVTSCLQKQPLGAMSGSTFKSFTLLNVLHNYSTVPGGAASQQVLGYDTSPINSSDQISPLSTTFLCQLSTPYVYPARGRYSNIKEFHAIISAIRPAEFYMEWETVGGLASATYPSITPITVGDNYTHLHAVRKRGPGVCQGVRLTFVNVPAQITVGLIQNGTWLYRFEIQSIFFIHNSQRRITQVDSDA